MQHGLTGFGEHARSDDRGNNFGDNGSGVTVETAVQDEPLHARRHGENQQRRRIENQELLRRIRRRAR